MDKIYLILGASSEVGMAYIKKINEEQCGAMVLACYRTMSDAFAKVCDNCSNLEVVTMKTDLADNAQVNKLIKTIKEKNIVPTHILHLAALPFEYMRIRQWDEERAKKEMQVALFSFAAICKEFLPAMAKQKYGKVVAMLTAYTLGVPPKYMSDYVACKYALLGYIKAASAEYAGKININAISPNMMETRFLQNIDEKIIAISAENSAMKRNISVSEVIEGIDFLLSDKASYMNGANLNLSGGDYM